MSYRHVNPSQGLIRWFLKARFLAVLAKECWGTVNFGQFSIKHFKIQVSSYSDFQRIFIILGT